MTINTGTIFAIKKYAIHDGPNIRTTIFFKGCPLVCHWCHNPEGIDREIAVVTSSAKCVACNECIDQCPTKSLSNNKNTITRNTESCSICENCVSVCPALAHETTGWEVEVDDIIEEVKKDTLFYDQSGGGVTFSGGEPLMQPGFLLQLLQACGDLGIHRAVDTCAYVRSEIILGVSEYTDLFLIDLKHMDSTTHAHFTGVPNELILDNIRLLAKRGSALCLRIPLIDGFNCDDDNIMKSGEFIAGLPGVEQVDILPYHSIAAAKYKKLQRHNPGAHFVSLTKEKIARCMQILTDYGLKVLIGG